MLFWGFYETINFGFARPVKYESYFLLSLSLAIRLAVIEFGL
jgi:hypothetical protein